METMQIINITNPSNNSTEKVELVVSSLEQYYSEEVARYSAMTNAQFEKAL